MVEASLGDTLYDRHRCNSPLFHDFALVQGSFHIGMACMSVIKREEKKSGHWKGKKERERERRQRFLQQANETRICFTILQ